MMNTLRSVTVHQVPSSVTAAEARLFVRELQNHIAPERPRVVLDCANVRQMDDAMLHLLLCCLEEAMKSNGDVKLSSVTPGAEAAMRMARVHRLFETYPTNAAAVQSYQMYFRGEASPSFAYGEGSLGSESAA